MTAGDPNIAAGEFDDRIFEIIAFFVVVDGEAHGAAAVDEIDVVVTVCILPGYSLGSVGERSVRSDMFGGAGVDDDVVVADLIF